MSERRLLLVHAHPDDESITTGATMAYYAARGVQVTLLTCTLGEEGEILVPRYARLEAAQADQLGGLRIGELDAAMSALGVSDHRFLGGAGRFRDSGMMGSPANEHPRAFWRAATDDTVFAAAVADVLDVVREVRPQVVITYDDNGDYGHPDHVMAHRVASAAVDRSREDQWSVAKLYWTATPTSVLRADLAELTARPQLPFAAVDVATLGFGVGDELITTSLDASEHLDAKLAALRAHRTQIDVEGEFFALSNGIGRVAHGVEHFRLAAGVPGDVGADGREHDLFAGTGV